MARETEREYMHTASAPPSRAAMPRAKREVPELDVPLGESCDRHPTRPGEALASTSVSKDTASLTYIMRVWVGPLPALGPLHPALGRVQCCCLVDGDSSGGARP